MMFKRKNKSKLTPLAHGNDVLMGGGGEDILVGGAGDDILDGDDNYYPTTDPGYSSIPGGEFPEQFYIAPKFDWSVSQDAGNPFSDTFHSVANYSYARDVGAADIIYGGTGNDRINGEFGDDTLLGEDGDDIISGGDGSDTIFGGAATIS